MKKACLVVPDQSNAQTWLCGQKSNFLFQYGCLPSVNVNTRSSVYHSVPNKNETKLVCLITGIREILTDLRRLSRCSITGTKYRQWLSLSFMDLVKVLVSYYFL
jgi:hypothetical protein